MQNLTKNDNIICPYCNNKAELVEAKAVYGKNAKPEYGKYYLCECIPGMAYVGCHPRTDKPLGTLADRELRTWRQSAHRALDLAWEMMLSTNIGYSKKQALRRKDAYAWLANELNISVMECHIGQFDIDACKKVVEICTKKKEYYGKEAI